jgi:hypothetical protein
MVAVLTWGCPMTQLFVEILEFAQAISAQREWLLGSVVVIGLFAAVKAFFKRRKELNKFRQLLTQKWVIVGALFIGCFLAWRAERHEVSGLQTQLLTTEPEFSSKNPRMEPVVHPITKQTLYHRVHLSLTQLREHAAKNLTGNLLILDTKLGDTKPILNQPVNSVNDIPQNGPLSFISPELTIQSVTPEAFVVLVIDYSGATTGIGHTQAFYYRWAGAKDGVYQRDFFSPTVEEKNRLVQYMRTALGMKLQD